MGAMKQPGSYSTDDAACVQDQVENDLRRVESRVVWLVQISKHGLRARLVQRMANDQKPPAKTIMGWVPPPGQAPGQAPAPQQPWQPPAPAARGWQLAGSAVLAAAALGGVLLVPARWALQSFHHPGLISLLVGGIAAALALPAALLGLSLLALLSRLPGSAPPPRGLRGPLALYAVGWALALPGLAGGVALTLRMLMNNPRMTPPLRALNLALWTPLLALGALGLGHLLGRGLAGAAQRRAARSTAPGRARLDSPWAVVLLPLGIGLLLALLGGLAYLPTLRQLDRGEQEEARRSAEVMGNRVVTLADVGGLERVKERLHAAFLAPLRHAGRAQHS